MKLAYRLLAILTLFVIFPISCLPVFAGVQNNNHIPLSITSSLKEPDQVLTSGLPTNDSIITLTGSGSKTIKDVNIDFSPAKIVFSGTYSSIELSLVDNDVKIEYESYYGQSDVMPLYRSGIYTAIIECKDAWLINIIPISNEGTVSVSGTGSFVGDFFTFSELSYNITFSAYDSSGSYECPIVLKLCEKDKDDNLIYSEMFLSETTQWGEKITKDITIQPHPNLEKCFWRIISSSTLIWSITTK